MVQLAGLLCRLLEVAADIGDEPAASWRAGPVGDALISGVWQAASGALFQEADSELVAGLAVLLFELLPRPCPARLPLAIRAEADQVTELLGRHFWPPEQDGAQDGDDPVVMSPFGVVAACVLGASSGRPQAASPVPDRAVGLLLAMVAGASSGGASGQEASTGGFDATAVDAAGGVHALSLGAA